jgi:hypothetical protein
MNKQRRAIFRFSQPLEQRAAQQTQNPVMHNLQDVKEGTAFSAFPSFLMSGQAIMRRKADAV